MRNEKRIWDKANKPTWQSFATKILAKEFFVNVEYFICIHPVEKLWHLNVFLKMWMLNKLKHFVNSKFKCFYCLVYVFQANVVLKEKETFIEYLQKQLDETKSKLDSEVCAVYKCTYKCVKEQSLGVLTEKVQSGWGRGGWEDDRTSSFFSLKENCWLIINVKLVTLIQTWLSDLLEVISFEITERNYLHSDADPFQNRWKMTVKVPISFSVMSYNRDVKCLIRYSVICFANS